MELFFVRFKYKVYNNKGIEADDTDFDAVFFNQTARMTLRTYCNKRIDSLAFVFWFLWF